MIEASTNFDEALDGLAMGAGMRAPISPKLPRPAALAPRREVQQWPGNNGFLYSIRVNCPLDMTLIDMETRESWAAGRAGFLRPRFIRHMSNVLSAIGGRIAHIMPMKPSCRYRLRLDLPCPGFASPVGAGNSCTPIL